MKIITAIMLKVENFEEYILPSQSSFHFHSTKLFTTHEKVSGQNRFNGTPDYVFECNSEETEGHWVIVLTALDGRIALFGNPCTRNVVARNIRDGEGSPPEASLPRVSKYFNITQHMSTYTGSRSLT